jgi:hypothetical protein
VRGNLDYALLQGPAFADPLVRLKLNSKLLASGAGGFRDRKSGEEVCIWDTVMRKVKRRANSGRTATCEWSPSPVGGGFFVPTVTDRQEINFIPCL